MDSRRSKNGQMSSARAMVSEDEKGDGLSDETGLQMTQRKLLDQNYYSIDHHSGRDQLTHKTFKQTHGGGATDLMSTCDNILPRFKTNKLIEVQNRTPELKILKQKRTTLSKVAEGPLLSEFNTMSQGGGLTTMRVVQKTSSRGQLINNFSSSNKGKNTVDPHHFQHNQGGQGSNSRE